jgi:hypothetical protein
MKMLAMVILSQDYLQMKKQARETALKKRVIFDYFFKNEETIVRLKEMMAPYRYPDDESCVELYNHYRKNRSC